MGVELIHIGFDSAAEQSDVEFGPYNSIMCRPGKIAAIPLNGSALQSGMIVAMDIYPHSAGSNSQTIWSIRNTVTNHVSLRLDYISNKLNVWVAPLSEAPYYAQNAPVYSVPRGKIPIIKSEMTHFYNLIR